MLQKWPKLWCQERGVEAKQATGKLVAETQSTESIGENLKATQKYLSR